MILFLTCLPLILSYAMFFWTHEMIERLAKFLSICNGVKLPTWHMFLSITPVLITFLYPSFHLSPPSVLTLNLRIPDAMFILPLLHRNLSM
ncbi:hypothetical protein BDW59DRAFT_53677 [Aspergillus cavernicola]|uniref:Uncharacterized protein n=1 Tax=Aspergillus cavernicola TaxID=176166 RepID=A0ABR4IMC4_9EURO